MATLNDPELNSKSEKSRLQLFNVLNCSSDFKNP